METEIRSSVEKVLHTILRFQPISRAKIAKLCGLSKVTVSESVEWLLNVQIVKELGITEISRGRPPMLLSVNGDAGVIVAIEADKLTSKIGISDLNGKLIRWEYLPPIDENPSVFVDIISQHLHSIQKEYSHCPLGVVGVGFAIIGSFNQETGIIEYSANQASWNAYPFKMKIESIHSGIPFLVGRQSQICALGEAAFGRLKQVNNLACLSSSWGTGVGLYTELEGQHLIQERHTRFGHTTIQYDGRRCTCGNRGCLEEYVSVRTLMKEFYPDQLPQLELFRNLCKSASQKDQKTIQVFQEMYRYMAIGIANIINAYTPMQICITGMLSELIEEPALLQIQTMVEEMVPPAYRKSFQLFRSELGEMAVIYGCFAYVRENLASLVFHRTDTEE